MKVTLKDDSLPDGAELYVKALGFLVNGKAVDFSGEEVKAFEAARGLSIEKAFADSSNIKLAKGGEN